MELKLQTTEQDVKLLGELLMMKVEEMYDIFPDEELEDYLGDFLMVNRYIDDLVGQGLITEWTSPCYIEGRKFYQYKKEKMGQ